MKYTACRNCELYSVAVYLYILKRLYSHLLRLVEGVVKMNFTADNLSRRGGNLSVSHAAVYLVVLVDLEVGHRYMYLSVLAK